MNVIVTVCRSAEWIKQARIEACDNVPRTVDLEVPISSLTTRVRAALLSASGGHYPSAIHKLNYDSAYEFNSSSHYGRSEFVVDEAMPTVAQVASAIDSIVGTIEEKRAEHVASKAAAEEAARLRREAEAELARRKAEAKELLHSEFEHLASRIESLTAERDLLSTLIVAIDEDVLAGAADENKLDKEAIESAVPSKIGRVFDRE